MLAAKASLAIRVDALGEDTGTELGIEHRTKLEARLRMLEEGQVHICNTTIKPKIIKKIIIQWGVSRL